jgi:hypothetical protein
MFSFSVVATQFALEMGFPEETLATSESVQMHKGWLANNCQPNFWKVTVFFYFFIEFK